MSSSETAAPRQHAFTGPALPQLPEPTHAERVRTLISLTSIATLSTISRKHAGFPFGSLMPFALDSLGRPIFLISNMAMHTQNLKTDSRCSPSLAKQGPTVMRLEPPEQPWLAMPNLYLRTMLLTLGRDTWLATRIAATGSTFPISASSGSDLYYVGGFGVMGWVEAQDYEHAAPDPLVEAAPGILAHMNTDHVDAMILLAGLHAGIEAIEATMTSVDRLGFSLRLKTTDGVKGARINFLREVATPQDTRAVLVEMVRQAKTRV
jgi:heme iron utilization protein